MLQIAMVSWNSLQKDTSSQVRWPVGICREGAAVGQCKLTGDQQE